jgi:hypothetical protein
MLDEFDQLRSQEESEAPFVASLKRPSRSRLLSAATRPAGGRIGTSEWAERPIDQCPQVAKDWKAMGLWPLGRRAGMRRLLATAVAVVTVVLGGSAVAASAAPTAIRGMSGALCGSGYVSANLPWGHKCLRAGEFCKVRNRSYLRYGFYCPSTGHLRYR